MSTLQQLADRITVATPRARRLEQTLAVTVAGLAASLQRHMPAGAYRDFYLWAISPENPAQAAYLRAIALSQLVKMTVELLDGIVDEPDWQPLLAHTVPMNVYQIYEVVSDNLAIGLAGAHCEDPHAGRRRRLLIGFNRAMAARLQGERAPAAQLLAPLQPAAAGVSLFDQSLIGDSHRTFVQTYRERRHDVPPDHLEYAGWAALVANVEAGADLARSLWACRGGELVRRGLIGRYEAVNRLLQRETLTLRQLADAGTYSILVIPTLAYYITVLAELVRPLDRFARIIADGSLAAVLADAALIVRLLNDLGTGLIRLAPEEQAALCERLRAVAERQPGPARRGTDMLFSTAQPAGLLTRIHKDVTFGEFNVCLYHLADTRSAGETFAVFRHNLAYFSRLYRQAGARLESGLAELSERAGEDWISRLIERFVRFHEVLYSHSYASDAGEYAI
jgi:hypothetical protein